MIRVWMNTGRRRGFYPSEIDSLPSDRCLTAEIKQAQYRASLGPGGMPFSWPRPKGAGARAAGPLAALAAGL
jgi:hypothetical protein